MGLGAEPRIRTNSHSNTSFLGSSPHSKVVLYSVQVNLFSFFQGLCLQVWTKKQKLLFSKNFICGLHLSYSGHFCLCCGVSRTETCCVHHVRLDVRCRAGSAKEPKVGLREE